MKRLTCTLLALTLAAAVGAGDEKKDAPPELKDPVDILKKVDAAARAVKAVQYDLVLDATAVQRGKLEASIMAAGRPAEGAYLPEKWRVDATITLPGANESIHLTGGCDGEDFYLIDHRHKIAYVDMDPAVLGPAQGTLVRSMFVEFLHPAPFNDEIHGKSQELRKSEKLGDEDCYVIHVVYASDEAPQATWWFSKKDFLPRQRVDEYRYPGLQGPIRRTVSKLVVDPKLADDAFKVTLPAGYEQSDDFAPSDLFGPPPSERSGATTRPSAA